MWQTIVLIVLKFGEFPTFGIVRNQMDGCVELSKHQEGGRLYELQKEADVDPRKDDKYRFVIIQCAKSAEEVKPQ